MTNSKSLARVVESLGGTVTGETNAGLLADIVRALGGAPTGNTNAELVGEIAAALGGTAGEGTNADRLRAVAEALDVDASGTNAEVLAAILAGLGGTPEAGDTNATLILGLSEHPPGPATDFPYLFWVVDGRAALAGWDPEYEVPSSYTLTVPEHDRAGNPVVGIAAGEGRPWLGATSLDAPSVQIIDNGAFKDSASLTAVDLPAIQAIGSEAFSGCTAIESIAFGDGLTIVQADSFSGLTFCNPLYMKLDGTAQSLAGKSFVHVHYQGDDLLVDPEPDPSMFKYTIENDEATIIGWADGFTPPRGGCPLLEFPQTDGNGHPVKALKLTRDDVSYEQSVFGIASKVSGPSIVSISDFVFYGCSMQSIDFPNLATIDYGTGSDDDGQSFRGCTGLGLDGATLNLPSLTYIGSRSFYGCNALTALNLPSVTHIGKNAFTECYQLASADFAAATTVEDNAFESTPLTTLNLPSVTHIGKNAFAYVNNLSSLTLGPLESLPAGPTPLDPLVFYDTDGTTVLEQTPANLANSTFVGSWSQLVKQ